LGSSTLYLEDEMDTDGELLDACYEAHSEAILQRILDAFKASVKRCEVTFHTTPHTIRAWLNAHSESACFRAPFA
jgi:hypothetical protein